MDARRSELRFSGFCWSIVGRGGRAKGEAVGLEEFIEVGVEGVEEAGVVATDTGLWSGRERKGVNLGESRTDDQRAPGRAVATRLLPDVTA